MWLPLAALLGCGETTAPAVDLSGTWLATQVEASTTVTLIQNGTAVTGSGTYWRFINPPSGTLTIRGTYSAPELTLTFRYDDGRTSEYTGVVRGAGTINGRETYQGGATDSLAFVRQ
jgi:hypothetical protein